MDMVNRVPFWVAIKENPVFARGNDVFEGDVRNNTELGFWGSWQRGNRDRLAFAPPDFRVEEHRLDSDILEMDVMDISLVAELKGNSTITAQNINISNENLRKIRTGFGAKFDAGGGSGKPAMTDFDVFARPIFLIGLGGFKDDRVVRADDVAIFDQYVLAMVRIDAIAIGQKEVVTDFKPLDVDVFAAHKMRRPESGTLKNDTADKDVLNVFKEKQGNPRIKRPIDEGIAAFAIKDRLVPIDGAFAGDRDVFGVFRI